MVPREDLACGPEGPPGPQSTQGSRFSSSTSSRAVLLPVMESRCRPSLWRPLSTPSPRGRARADPRDQPREERAVVEPCAAGPRAQERRAGSQRSHARAPGACPVALRRTASSPARARGLHGLAQLAPARACARGCRGLAAARRLALETGMRRVCHAESSRPTLQSAPPLPSLRRLTGTCLTPRATRRVGLSVWYQGVASLSLLWVFMGDEGSDQARQVIKAARKRP